MLEAQYSGLEPGGNTQPLCSQVARSAEVSRGKEAPSSPCVVTAR